MSAMSGFDSTAYPRASSASSLIHDAEDRNVADPSPLGVHKLLEHTEPQYSTRPEEMAHGKFVPGFCVPPLSDTPVGGKHILEVQAHATNLTLHRPLSLIESEIRTHMTPRGATTSTTDMDRAAWTSSVAPEPHLSRLPGDVSCELAEQHFAAMGQPLQSSQAHDSARLGEVVDTLLRRLPVAPVLTDLTRVPVAARERDNPMSPPAPPLGAPGVPQSRADVIQPPCPSHVVPGLDEQRVSAGAADTAPPSAADPSVALPPMPPLVQRPSQAADAVPSPSATGEARCDGRSPHATDNAPPPAAAAEAAVGAAVKTGPERPGSDVESLTIACDPRVYSLSTVCGAGSGPAATENGDQSTQPTNKPAPVDTSAAEAPSESAGGADPAAAAAAELPTIGTVLLSGDRLVFRCSLCGELCTTAGRLRAHYLQHVAPPEDAKPAAEGTRRRGRPPRAVTAAEPDGDAAGAVPSESEDGETTVRRTRSGRTRASPTPVSLKCETCGKVLSSANKFAVHQRMHSGERPHICTYCPKRCNDLGNLRKHEQLHFKARPFRCGTCGVTFWTALRQRSHRCKLGPAAGRGPAAAAPSKAEGAPDAASGDVSAPADEAAPAAAMAGAPTELATGATVAAATAAAAAAVTGDDQAPDRPPKENSPEPNVHSGLVPLVPVDCDVCGRRLRSVSGWQRHRRLHAGVRPYQCRFCDKTCNDSGNMRKHEAGHFKERPYRCDTCCITFINAWRLGLHVCKLRADGGAVGGAGSGAAPAPSAAAAAVEVEAVLDSKAPLPVPLPRGRHAPPPQLDARGKRRDHVCPVCGKALLSYASLEMHYRTHTGEKPFQCDECGKRFSIQGNLVVHTRIHTGERPFQCEECGKMFMYQSHLKVHKRAHSGARPYRCQFCQKGFAASSSRRVHEETVHSTERKFICETCGAAFKEKKHLKRHSWKKHQAEQEAAAV